MPRDVTPLALTGVIFGCALLLGTVQVVILLESCRVSIQAPDAIRVLRALLVEHLVELDDGLGNELLAGACVPYLHLILVTRGVLRLCKMEVTGPLGQTAYEDRHSCLRYRCHPRPC